jgi:hypothetical protein
MVMKRIAYILAVSAVLCATAFAQNDENFELEREKLALERERLALEREKLALEAKKAKMQKKEEPYNYSHNKGEVHLQMSQPMLNTSIFELDDEERRMETFFFFGIGSGLDYYYSYNRFVHLGVSALLNNLSEWDPAASVYIGFSNNHRVDRFSIGYGLSYSGNFLATEYYLDDEDLSGECGYSYTVYSSYGTFGLIFPAYIYFGKVFGLGVIYRPTFFRPNMKEKFKYEHLISLDLAFKIRLVKK